jgi:hypothetical protein
LVLKRHPTARVRRLSSELFVSGAECNAMPLLLLLLKTPVPEISIFRTTQAFCGLCFFLHHPCVNRRWPMYSPSVYIFDLSIDEAVSFLAFPLT